MSILESLARPLAHGVDYAQIARATLRRGDPLDVEWMIAGLPRHREALIRARYQHDVSSRSAGWGWLFGACVDAGWTEGAPQGLTERLTMHALKHWLGWSYDDAGKKLLSSHICPSCEGVAAVMDESLVIVCRACGGTGRREIRPYSLMRELGLPTNRINMVWQLRHAEALQMLDDEETYALGHMAKKLRD